MHFFGLPSSRLAAYHSESNTVRLLPIRAEEHLSTSYQGRELLAVSSVKALTFYDPAELLKASSAGTIEALSSVQFNKKLDGLTVND